MPRLKATDITGHGHGDAKDTGGGYECQFAKSFTLQELKQPKTKGGSDAKPGDTGEVRWAFSSSGVDPGPGLGGCCSEACLNPTPTNTGVL